MKLFNISWVLVLSVSILSGCATTMLEGPKFTEAKPPAAGESLVYFYRPNSTPFLLSPDLLVNGKKILSLGNQGYSYLYLKPGDYDIKVAWSFISGRHDLQGKVKLEAGKTYFIRSHGHVAYNTITYSSSGYLTSVPAENALNEMGHCIFIKPDLTGLKN